MATLSDIEKYRMSSGYYDIAAIQRDLNPGADALDLTFTAFFGGTDDDGSPVQEHELVALARTENERTAAERQAAAEAEGRELLAQTETATGDKSNRVWNRLVQLGFAELTGDAEDLSYELTAAGMALRGYRPAPDPYGDQNDIEEEPAFSRSARGGARPGAGRPRSERRQQGARPWIPIQTAVEAAQLRAMSPAERRARLVGEYAEVRGDLAGDVACGYRDGGDVVVSIHLQGAAEEIFTVQTARPVEEVIREELNRRLAQSGDE